MPAPNRLPCSANVSTCASIRQLQRLAPVAQEDRRRLIGDQHVERSGRDLRLPAGLAHDLGNDAVAAPITTCAMRDR